MGVMGTGTGRSSGPEFAGMTSGTSWPHAPGNNDWPKMAYGHAVVRNGQTYVCQVCHVTAVDLSEYKLRGCRLRG